MIAVGLMLALSGVATWLIVEAVKRHRVADHNSGAHVGIVEALIDDDIAVLDSGWLDLAAAASWSPRR